MRPKIMIRRTASATSPVNGRATACSKKPMVRKVRPMPASVANIAGWRGDAAQPVRGKGDEDLDRARKKAGGDARLPGHVSRVGGARRGGQVARGQHDEEGERDHDRRVQAIGQRAHIGAALPTGEAAWPRARRRGCRRGRTARSRAGWSDKSASPKNRGPPRTTPTAISSWTTLSSPTPRKPSRSPRTK